jgi:acyl-CoA synthetase (AMP-forming)/AMP-acid ligase II
LRKSAASPPSTTLMRAVGRVGQVPTMLRVLGAAGVIRPYPPHRLARVGVTLARWGMGPAGGFAAMTILHPDRLAVVDELGELTFQETYERSNRLANALRARGVGPGDGVAVMCRNHRGFVDISLAAAKLGADILYLNTAFAGPQLVDVLEREKPRIVVHDEEFNELLDKADTRERVLGWVDDPGEDALTLESLIAEGSTDEPTAPDKQSRIIILTSGTTGTPKGAPRSEAGIEAATALLSRLPLKSGWRTHIAAPLFHTWGCCSARPSCCGGSSSPKPRCARSSRRTATRWW